ncbi:MAG: ATP12 family protein, partial [Acetobacterales bacterium]
KALADAIAEELSVDSRILAGKGANDPALAPNFRIAAGAIDLLDCNVAARDALVRDLTSYGETDLVCIRADGPEVLVAREDACWGPICAWFAERFGAPLALSRGIAAAKQPDSVLTAVENAVAGQRAFEMAALSLATRAAGSVVIGLALIERSIDAGTAFTAASLEETFQIEHWGDDAEAARVREGCRQDLAQAARFIELLSED